MCVDQSFKILRTDSALDLMKAAHQKDSQNFQRNVSRALIGQIVMTRYNNKTYRIDDILWKENIMTTFDVS